MSKAIGSMKLLILAILLIAFGCQPNEIDSVSESDVGTLTITSAKKWFDANYVESGLTINGRQAGVGNTRKELKKQTRWNDAYTVPTAMGDAVVVPLTWEQNLLPRFRKGGGSTGTLSKEDSRLGLDHLSYAMIYKDKKKKETLELVTAVPDAEWANKPTTAFSGITFVEDWKGNFLRGYEYKAGKVVGEISPTSNGKKNGRLCFSQVELIVVQRVCTKQNGVLTDCYITTHSDGYETVATDCGGSTEYTGPTTVNETPTTIEYLTPILKVVSINVKTLASNVVKIIIDRLNDPCKKEVLNEIIGNAGCSDDKLGAVINKIISDLNGGSINNSMLEITVGEKDLGGTRVGQYEPTSGISGTLWLSTPNLAEAGREYIAAVLIHEFVHAYMSTFLINGQIDDISSPKVQHETMVKYVSAMTDYLEARYNVPLSAARAIVWSGLQGSKYWTGENGQNPLFTEDQKREILTISEAWRTGKAGRYKCPRE
ncbi:hypothetical protein FAES_0738 [Fibrella aestuarina BUZ 2]|uniref:SprT-like domain-containing protein n=1 Tax=Fibrella aestuarina BUZ 2 TaxID=1166018 RepID=I0K3P6_9BACT|nr:hypothetical protein [Fibrella aestuarina]CCG98749.1 hypothetical protein FAES_0738 [Fibrella aestuarina BUZ 2]